MKEPLSYSPTTDEVKTISLFFCFWLRSSSGCRQRPGQLVVLVNVMIQNHTDTKHSPSGFSWHWFHAGHTDDIHVSFKWRVVVSDWSTAGSCPKPRRRTQMRTSPSMTVSHGASNRSSTLIYLAQSASPEKRPKGEVKNNSVSCQT